MVLVCLSFVLSALLWTSGNTFWGVEEKAKNTDSSTKLAAPSIVEHQLTDFYQPIYYIAHHAGNQGIGQAIVDGESQAKIDQFLTTATFDRILEEEELTHTQYAELIQAGTWLELVYDDVLPLGIFKERFESVSKDWSDFTFDRMLISRTDPALLYFYNESQKVAASLKALKFDVTAFENLVTESAAEGVPVFSATLKDCSVYLPVHTQDISHKSYIIEKLPNSIYMNYFFPDTSMVDSRTTKNITRYIDLTKEVSINQETNILTFLSQKSTTEISSLTDRFIRSFEIVNDLENWQDDIIYHMYDAKNERISFLRYIGDYPVFTASNNESMIEISIEGDQLSHILLPLRFIQTPINIQSAELEEIPSGFTVLDDLRDHGIVVTEEVEKLTIGYTWKERDENQKVIDLIPQWYVCAHGKWQPLESFIAEKTGSEVAYEF